MLEVLSDIQSDVQDAYTKSYKEQQFYQFLDEMLEDLKNMQLNFEEGTNVFSNTLCSLNQKSCNVAHLDYNNEDDCLNIFDKGKIIFLFLLGLLYLFISF